MANPPDDHILDWLSSPSVLVNLFRIKRPDQDSDRYLYVPANSFRFPGEHALENVDINPDRYPYTGVDLESLTYVPQGPAFVAWPVDKRAVPTSGGGVELSEFRNRRMHGMQMLGRRIVSPTDDVGTPVLPELPGFSAPTAYSGIDGVTQLYEHSAEVNNAQKYMYDFMPEAHSGWGKGYPKFSAMPPEYMWNALNQAEPRQPANADELTSAATAKQLADLSKDVLKPGKRVDQQTVDNMVAFFTGKGLPVKAFTTGGSVDAGLGITGMVERGIIWDKNRGPIQAYTTFGAGISAAAGATVNLNFGLWWGETLEDVLKNMEGRGYYLYAGATLGVGLNIIVTFSADGLPYGLTISPQFGPELEVGIGQGMTYTFFYNGPPAGTYMTMPSGVWG